MLAIATCLQLPEPDVDQDLLGVALAQAGVAAELVAWDDPKVDWALYQGVVIRSTWNYITRLAEFQAWSERVETRTRLWNPASVVRWNTHKSYLRDLEADGVPVVPTVWLPQGDATTLASIQDARAWDQVVIKPQVGAGSFRTERFSRSEAERGEAFLRALVREREVMVQPYLRSVEGYGERSLIWIDGALTHAIRKSPRLGDAAESVSEALPIADDERALAEQVLQPRASSLLYARVDVARDEAGRCQIMELELVEPSLFLRQAPAAVERLVAGLKRRLER